jgi:hypothetical protein
MNIKKLLLATLAGVVGNSVAYGILFVLLQSYLERDIIVPTGASTEGSPVLSIIATVSLALIMAYIYPKGYEGGSPVSEGLRFGILMGLFFGIPYAVNFNSMFPISYAAILVLALFYALEITAGGLAIGLVYGRMKQASN